MRILLRGHGRQPPGAQQKLFTGLSHGSGLSLHFSQRRHCHSLEEDSSSQKSVQCLHNNWDPDHLHEHVYPKSTYFSIPRAASDDPIRILLIIRGYLHLEAGVRSVLISIERGNLTRAGIRSLSYYPELLPVEILHPSYTLRPVSNLLNCLTQLGARLQLASLNYVLSLFQRSYILFRLQSQGIHL